MKIKEKGNTIIIKKSSDSLQAFSEKISAQFHQYADKNIIIDLHKETLRPADFIFFETLANHQLKNKKSFVIVGTIDFDEIDNAIIVVPTLQEAHDFIEMEEIERDLGF